MIKKKEYKMGIIKQEILNFKFNLKMIKKKENKLDIKKMEILNIIRN